MRTRGTLSEDWRARGRLQRTCCGLISGRERFEEDQMEDLNDIRSFRGENSDEQHALKKAVNGFEQRPSDELQENLNVADVVNEINNIQECVDANKVQMKPESKELVKAKINLNYMAEQILQKVVIILHDDNLYQYTGRSYKIIRNDKDLLRLVRSSVSDDAFGSFSTNSFGYLMTFLKADNRLIPADYEKRLSKSQFYIAFRNGVLDIRTMELYKHSEKYLVFYELDAEWKEESNPAHFMEFLRRASGNDVSIIKRIVETLGYLLSAVNEGKYFFVMGTASDSGKSTLGKMLQHFIGEEYVSHLSTYQMGNRFALGDIDGKTLNLSMDLPKGKLNPVTVSIIKQITGGDSIMTEKKYDDMRDGHSRMRFLFASNYPVTVSRDDDDESFWNRMIVIPFQYSVDKKDMDINLIEKLLKEKDDIISLCLRAFHQVLCQGCIFSECNIADEMKRQWREQEDDLLYTLQGFLGECIEITGNQEDSLYAKDFYSAYQEYCQRSNCACMTYGKVIDWCTRNIPDCERKRIHHTGTNPRSGFRGMRLVQQEKV